MKKAAVPLLVVILIIVSSCTPKKPAVSDWESYLSKHEEWQHHRIERLKAETGWLNLAGLLWLSEGENTFGSDSSNALVFPEKFSAFAGKIILDSTSISLTVDPSVEIIADQKVVTETLLRHDQESNTTNMELGSFRWFIIKRGDRYAIRLRDLEHPRIATLEHIPSYPVSKEWLIEAEFIAYDSAKTIDVPTAIENFKESYKVPGELKFKVKGKTQTLLPFSSGSGFFLIVGDRTNGIDTYGAGRFLYIDNIEDNKVIIDFNRAYNPPCAFTPFATCPLPPLENILNIEIKAGEKAVHMQ